MTRNNFRYKTKAEKKVRGLYKAPLGCIDATISLPSVTLADGVIVVGQILRIEEMTNDGPYCSRTIVSLAPGDHFEYISNPHVGCIKTRLSFPIWYDPNNNLIYNVIGVNKTQFTAIDQMVEKLKSTGWIKDDAKYDTSDVIVSIPYSTEDGVGMFSAYDQI